MIRANRAIRDTRSRRIETEDSGEMDGLFGVTYIRMSSDLLNDGVIEMARVTQETTSDIVCVLDALEDVGCNWELRSLSKLCSDVLALEVDVLHPAVVVGSG